MVDWPEIDVDVDRDKAGQVGLTQRDVSNSLLISLSGSGQIAPTEWLDYRTGVSYFVTVQTPQYRLDSMPALMHTPIVPPFTNVNSTTATSLAGSAYAGDSFVAAAPSQSSMAYGNPGAAAATPQLLSNLAAVSRNVAPEIINHYNVQPVFDIYANLDRRDLGAVGAAVEKIVDRVSAKLPRGTTIDVRGQIATMQSSFYRLGLGMVFAVVLVYLLMAVNFQSWLDPFIILMALPGAMAGIVWMLFLTQTTFSVPSLMGAIMCIGVATANSILMVVFANDQREEGMDARAAALSAGNTRIRPVLMTASAMIIGMLPMALGMGEGGEQNAPLGRAVIGGLLLATLTTLFVVPLVYSLLRTKAAGGPREANCGGGTRIPARRTAARGIVMSPIQANQTEEQLRAEIESLKKQLQTAAAAGHARPAPAAPSFATLAAVLLLVIGLAVAGYFLGYLPRQRREQVLAAEASAEVQSLPVVNVRPVERAASHAATWCCPAISRPSPRPPCWRAPAVTSASATWISATASTSGQVLAEIEAPELNQQIKQAQASIDQANSTVQQAQAALVQGRANENLAKVTAQRWTNLLARGAVSRQETDTYNAQYAAQQANVLALEKAVAAARSNGAGRGGQPGPPQRAVRLPYRARPVRRGHHSAQHR